MDILEFIPEGKENAISRKQLVDILRISDRKIRDIIAHARLTEVILSSDDGGYYIPLNTELLEVKGYLKREEARARSIYIGLNPVKKLLMNEKSKQIKGQLTIFDMEV